MTAALVVGADRKVEKVRLAGSSREDEVPHELRASSGGKPPRATYVARLQRIVEVAARPRVRIDRALDGDDLFEILLAHRSEMGNVFQHRAHRCSSSALVKATLSR